MTPVFERDVWPWILNMEGDEFVNDPDDPGGATKYGVTEAVARAFGWRGRMDHLTEEFAISVAKERYWDAMRLDQIAAHCVPLAAEMFEAGYHMGVYWPSVWLQQWLNELNNHERWYHDIEEDGRIGPITIGTLDQYLAKRGDLGAKVLVSALNADQAVRYKLLSREKYTFGWMAKRVANDGFKFPAQP